MARRFRLLVVLVATLAVLVASVATASANGAAGLWESGHTPDLTDCGPGGDDVNGFCFYDDWNEPVSLGVRFTTADPVFVVGVRAYRVDDGMVTGTLWEADVTDPATGALPPSTTAAFPSWAGSNGWQDMHFASPVPISPGQTYVASYDAPNAVYAYEYNYFTSSRIVGPITALGGASGINGVFTYGSQPNYPFPENTYRYMTYWVTPLWVANEAPIADPNGPYLVPVGGTANFDGSGSYDPEGYGITYEWTALGGTLDDDGLISPTFTAGATPGIYDVALAVTDEQGVVSDTVRTTVVIYDPSGGFVTGGGWIYSAAGAYRPNTALEGKATFGFVSKYKKGADTPTGNTAFQFKVGDLKFQSSSYQWLVVTGKDYAKFKGTGTINGMGEYKFMIWAGDDVQDTFRIKIWYEDNSEEIVVYDNDSDQGLGGGAVVVHTKK